jgi:hypothetical protein
MVSVINKNIPASPCCWHSQAAAATVGVVVVVAIVVAIIVAVEVVEMFIITKTKKNE